MRHTVWSLFVFLLASGSAAAAGEDRDELLRSAGESFGRFYRETRELARSPTSGDDLPAADDCDAAIASSRARGVKDGDLLFSYDFNQHPKAKDNRVAFAEMPAVCAEYRPLYAAYAVARDLKLADGVLMRIRDGFLKPGDSSLSASTITFNEQAGDPAKCKATVEAARKLDPAMRSSGISGRLTLDEFDVKVCDELGKLQPAWVAEAREALRKNREKAMAPYIAAGIGGKKLDLIIQYEGVYWRLPGGDRTDDPKKLAKATALFQWLEADDRADPRYVIHTIRKYRFAGNDLLGTSEKTYRRPKGAAVGDVFR